MAQCGACTVHVDGEARRSCVMPVGDVGGQADHDDRGARAPAAAARGAAGVDRRERAAVRVLPGRADHVGGRAARGEPDADRRGHRRALSANLCRCGTYPRIRARRASRGRGGAERWRPRADEPPRAFLHGVRATAGALVDRRCALGPAAGGAAVMAARRRRPASSSPTRGSASCPTDDDHLHARPRRDGAGHDDRRTRRWCAEELEVDPATIEIEHADARRAYDNPRQRRSAIQITGGSTSTRSSWRPLREAGAVAREMLRAAAAAARGACRSPSASRATGAIRTRRAARATYGELVEARRARRTCRDVDAQAARRSARDRQETRPARRARRRSTARARLRHRRPAARAC